MSLNQLKQMVCETGTPTPQQTKHTSSKGGQSKNAFSMQQIAKVLDKANKDDIKQLKNHWQKKLSIMLKIMI